MTYTKLVDVNGNPISAQAAYDAAMSGLVYIYMQDSGLDAHMLPISFITKKIGEEIVTVIFMCTEGSFYAGEYPNI